MIKKLFLLLMMLMLFTVACDPIQNPSDSDKPSAEIQPPYDGEEGEIMTFTKKPPLDSNFYLRLNEEENEVYLPGNVAVKLTRIKDSRCPVGTECVWQGNVQVVLEIDLVGEDPYEEVLVLGGASAEEPGFLEFYGNTYLTLLGIDPVPTADDELKPEDQIVVFSVTRYPIQ